MDFAGTLELTVSAPLSAPPDDDSGSCYKQLSEFRGEVKFPRNWGEQTQSIAEAVWLPVETLKRRNP